MFASKRCSGTLSQLGRHFGSHVTRRLFNDQKYLAHEWLGAQKGAANAKTLVVLHGLMGYRRNWYNMAKMLSNSDHNLRILLVDLRCHGDSRGFTPPHSVDACADDLIKLSHHLKAPFDIVCGHSFGGKVALRYAELERHHPIEQLWVLDTYPASNIPASALSGSFQGTDVPKVLSILASVATPIPSRLGLKEQLISAGLAPTVSSWLTTNLRVRPEGDGFDWKFELPNLTEMFQSYVDMDSFSALASPPHTIQGCIHFVRAGLEKRWTPELIAKLENSAIQSKGRTKVNVLEDSGHWLHYDDPDGLYQLLDSFLQKK